MWQAMQEVLAGLARRSYFFRFGTRHDFCFLDVPKPKYNLLLMDPNQNSSLSILTRGTCLP